MLKYILFFIFSVTGIEAKEQPFSDNLLFAFDKCRSFKLDLKKNTIEEQTAKGFDMHCLEANSDNKIFKCTYFDTGSDKRGELEIFEGNRDELRGKLRSKSDSWIQISLKTGTASFESSHRSSDALSDSKKLCVGIFLFEKDALKRKK